MTALAGARVVTPDGVLDDGFVAVADGVIDAVGAADDRPFGSAVDLRGAWLLPGFIDLHMHGGGGCDVTASAEALRTAVDFHRARGTTRTLVSLVAAPVDDLVEQLGWIADLTAAGVVLGAHLEGPFLAATRAGAQNTAHLLEPDLAVFAKLHDAAAGCLQVITVAPELPEAIPLIQEVVEQGVVAALGHSDATFDEAARAIAAGATLATHLFNAMRPLHHRDPGLAGAALAAGLPSELINDGVHVHPAMARLVDELVLVTDAIDAAGAGDGEYVLGGQHVEVHGGAARLRATGSLAGSTTTMADVVRRSVVRSGLSLIDASRAASARPAAVLGVAGRFGSIAPGRVADLVVMDDDLQLRGVMVDGEWSTPLTVGE